MRKHWRTLGLAPTDDERAIRRAYAARLKALDPDDREGFIALRAALDWTRDRAVNDEYLFDDEDEQAPTAAPEGVVQLPEPDWQAALATIEAMVWADPPDSDDARATAHAALTAEAERLLALPDLADVGVAQAVEQRLAQLAAYSMPRADALIGPAARRFDWAAQARRWDCDWAVRQAMQRRGDVAWLMNVPRYSTYRRAFDLLRSPERPPHRRLAGMVEDFLREVDVKHPTLRADMDEAAVEAWEALVEARRAAPARRLRTRAKAGLGGLGRLAGVVLASWTGRLALLAVLLGLALLLPGGLVVLRIVAIASVVHLIVRSVKA